MDAHQLFQDFGTLGPALGSVAAMGLITYFLIKLITQVIEKMLDMFGKVGVSLSEINSTMKAHSTTLSQFGENLKANTQTTELMVALLKQNKSL